MAAAQEGGGQGQGQGQRRGKVLRSQVAGGDAVEDGEAAMRLKALVYKEGYDRYV